MPKKGAQTKPSQNIQHPNGRFCHEEVDKIDIFSCEKIPGKYLFRCNKEEYSKTVITKNKNATF